MIPRNLQKFPIKRINKSLTVKTKKINNSKINNSILFSHFTIR